MICAQAPWNLLRMVMPFSRRIDWSAGSAFMFMLEHNLLWGKLGKLRAKPEVTLLIPNPASWYRLLISNRLSTEYRLFSLPLNACCALHFDTQSNKAATVHYCGTAGVITESAGSTHTRLISVYIPSLASGHHRGEPRVELIYCPPPFLQQCNTANCSLFVTSAESILSCICL